MSADFVALITGFTGETGKALLKELLRSKKFSKVILVGRRNVEFDDEIYREKTVNKSETVRNFFDVAFSLGTTSN